jgi:hypothetical protein
VPLLANGITSSVDGKGPAMIVDVRCSSQYSNPEDAQGSESAQRLQSLQKSKKQIESQLEFHQSKEHVLREVLVAYAANASFDFGSGLDRYDEKKLEVRVKREALEEELAVLEKKIREVGVDVSRTPAYGITGSTPLFSLLT